MHNDLDSVSRCRVVPYKAIHFFFSFISQTTTFFCANWHYRPKICLVDEMYVLRLCNKEQLKAVIYSAFLISLGTRTKWLVLLNDGMGGATQSTTWDAVIGLNFFSGAEKKIHVDRSNHPSLHCTTIYYLPNQTFIKRGSDGFIKERPSRQIPYYSY